MHVLNPRFVILLLLFSFSDSHTLFAQKAELGKILQKNEPKIWKAATQIWDWAEPGYQEHQSSQLLSDLLEESGFQIRRGVAEIPTAFVAEFGTGNPIIGFLGEYDALPGMSQTAVPYREVREGQYYGHACGHHLFGAGSAAAAITIAEQIKLGQIKGTVRYYGCPAEEGGSGKVFMVRAGLFSDCDAVLHWHPSNRNAGGARSSLARIAVKFRFRGKAAHAAGSPEEGRSALDAVALTNHAAELLREHVPEKTRIHYSITAGGDAPNVVPEFSEVYYYIRHPQAKMVKRVYERLLLCAKAGALATETKLEVDYQGGIMNLLPNEVLAEVTFQNLKELAHLQYDEAEQLFAVKIQETLLKKESISNVAQVYDLTGATGKGSTDVGDVSWSVPTAGFNTSCWVPGTPAHSWQAVACGNTSIARKGMNLAAHVLSASAWDLYHKPELLQEAKAELKKRTLKTPYKSFMTPEQKPLLNYRDLPSPVSSPRDPSMN